jgi:AraC-like DNA-binding protein
MPLSCTIPTAERAMTIEYRELEPAADLALFVRRYWLLAGESYGVNPEAIFPDGAPEIVFNFGDPVREHAAGGAQVTNQPAAMLVGQMTRAVWIAPTGRLFMVGVKLASWGVAAFCDVDASATRDQTIALRSVTGARHALVLEPGEFVGRSDACIADGLNRALRVRLAHVEPRRLRRLTGVATALSSPTPGSVGAWTKAMGCSTRTLERAFDTYVGVPPIVILRLRRFQRALRLASDCPGRTLADIAARAGYSDQSHMVRECREFAGVPPSAARATLTEFSRRFLAGADPA